MDNFHDIVYGSRRVGHKRQSVSRSQKNDVFDKQKGKCWFCKKRLGASHTHYDHIKEVSRGGKSTTRNLRAVCANCHYDRHNRDKAKKADKRKTRPQRRSNSLSIGGVAKTPNWRI